MSEGSGEPSTWKYVGIGCAILAVIAACALGSCVLFCGGAIGAGIAAMEPPAEATRAFFAAVRSGDVPAAYAQTAESYRDRHTLEQFTSGLSGMPALAASADQTISSRNVQAGAGATLGGTVSGPGGDTPFTAHLVEEGGLWRIEALSVGSGSL